MAVNWHEIFGLTMSPLELVIRGSAVYLFLLAVFRTILQRDIGAVGMADVLLLVIIADASQNAMAGEYKSVGDGFVLISTIIGWNILFDWLAFRFPRLRRLLRPPELCLIKDGRINYRNLRREFLSEDELFAKLRENGIEDPRQVRLAFLESDGAVTVIRKEERNGAEGASARKAMR